jgi:membrane fusion protein (multidrug efflux system)
VADSTDKDTTAVQSPPGSEEQWQEVAPPRRRSYLRDHPAVKWGLIVGGMVVLVSLIVIWRYYAVRESTDDAEIDGHVTPISARVGGTVVSLNFRDNQFVDEGAVLVQLDPKDYQVAVAHAEADLADAKASAEAAGVNVPITHISTSNQLKYALAARTAAQRQVDAARARVAEAEANYVKVAKDLERMAELVRKDEISQQQYDSAVASEKSAQATVDAAYASMAAAESQVAQAEAAVRTAETAPQQVAMIKARHSAAIALVQRAEAALAQARLNLEYCTVRAPGAGIVSKRSAEVGQVVQPGQPLAALVLVRDIYVTANFKETELKNMRPGQQATIHVDAYDRDLKGHVDSIGGATGARFSLLPPENATGNYVKVVQRVPVKIVFDSGQDPHHLLRPGMSVEPTVLTK